MKRLNRKSASLRLLKTLVPVSYFHRLPPHFFSPPAFGGGNRGAGWRGVPSYVNIIKNWDQSQTYHKSTRWLRVSNNHPQSLGVIHNHPQSYQKETHIRIIFSNIRIQNIYHIYSKDCFYSLYIRNNKDFGNIWQLDFQTLIICLKTHNQTFTISFDEIAFSISSVICLKVKPIIICFFYSAITKNKKEINSNVR